MPVRLAAFNVYNALSNMIFRAFNDCSDAHLMIATITRCAGILLFVSIGLTRAVQADVMIGAFVPDDGFDRTEIRKLNTVLPKKMAHIHMFTDFSRSLETMQRQLNNIVSEGAMPLISWMPIDQQRPNTNILPEIVAGDWDHYIDAWIKEVSLWLSQYNEFERPRLAIRFAHEFNGNWFPYSDDPMNFISAWQYLHRKASQSELKNQAEWVWSVSRANVDTKNDFTAYYPGHEYVDWTSIDGYNWGSNHHFTQWTSFRDVFAESYITMVENYPSKPIWLTEIGCAEPRDKPNIALGMQGNNADINESKSDWIREMLADLKTHFPAVRAMTLFNINKELSWSLTERGNTGLEAFIKGVSSEYFTSDYLTVNSTGLGFGYTAHRLTKALLGSAERLRQTLYASVESISRDGGVIQTSLAEPQPTAGEFVAETQVLEEANWYPEADQATSTPQAVSISIASSDITRLTALYNTAITEPEANSAQLTAIDIHAIAGLDSGGQRKNTLSELAGWFSSIFTRTETPVTTQVETLPPDQTDSEDPSWFASIFSNSDNLDSSNSDANSAEEERADWPTLASSIDAAQPAAAESAPETLEPNPSEPAYELSRPVISLTRQRALLVSSAAQLQSASQLVNDKENSEESAAASRKLVEGFRQFYARDSSSNNTNLEVSHESVSDDSSHYLETEVILTPRLQIGLGAALQDR